MAGSSIHTVAKRVIACPILLKLEEGFNIPLVRSLFVSRYSDWLFAGTYRSNEEAYGPILPADQAQCAARLHNIHLGMTFKLSQ